MGSPPPPLRSVSLPYSLREAVPRRINRLIQFVNMRVFVCEEFGEGVVGLLLLLADAVPSLVSAVSASLRFCFLIKAFLTAEPFSVVGIVV